MNEVKRLQEDPPAGISAAPQENNIMLWNAVISGPEDTPWDGDTNILSDRLTNCSICFSNVPSKYLRGWKDMFGHPAKSLETCNYSHYFTYIDPECSPPEMKVNIHETAIGLRFLLRNLLMTGKIKEHIFVSLLCDPNPDVPANSEAAQLFNENKRLYNRKVREIVEESQTADGPSGA